MEIDLNTDWGAKGAQLTGAQVQAFIKKQFEELIDKDTTLQSNISKISTKLEDQTSKIEAVTDGVFVAYHRRSDNWPLAVPYWNWPIREADGEVADGVLVLVDGRPPILVSPTDKTLFWSYAEYEVDDKVGNDYEVAFADFEGQIHTASIMASSAKLFDNDQIAPNRYAAAWCFNYDRSFEYLNPTTGKIATIGVLKNKWWLPSIAELVIIWKHKYAINLCLSVIKDAKPILNTWYWSSTEASPSTAWRLHMGNGAIQGSMNKTSFQHQTRAVTSFFNPSIFNGESDLENEMQVADSHFKRYGDCIVYMADENAKPVSIKYPLSEEKIQSAIIKSKYTDNQIALIQRNYQLSISEGFTDAGLKAAYKTEYDNLMAHQNAAIKVAHGALVKKA